jgi:hypothetical protein
MTNSYNRPTPEQLGRLPRWARDYVTYLEMRLAEARKELAVRDGTVDLGPGPSATVNPYSDHPLALPRDTMVRFHLDSGRYLDVEVRGVPARLVVLSSDLQLVVHPKSGNVVELHGGRPS